MHPLNEISHSGASQFSAVKEQRMIQRSLVLVIASPVGNHQIHLTILVEITRGHTTPPARHLMHAQRGGDAFLVGPFNRCVPWLQCASLVSEQADGPPLLSENQLRKSIAVEITPKDSLHDPSLRR